MAGERVHPSWVVPGGVNAPLAPAVRDRILAGLPAARQIARRTLQFFKGVVDGFQEEIAAFGTTPTMYAGMTDADGGMQFYAGRLRFLDPQGEIAAQVTARDYAQSIGEEPLPNSYLKAPFYKPLGFPAGVYRVGPLARLNVAGRCGTPEADLEFAEFHQRYGRVVESSFHYHYARLIEIIHALEKMESLLADPALLDTHVRAHAGVNALEGVGMIEAPRGVLIHHYRVDEQGAIRWANLIVATGHNNLAINRSIDQVSRRFVDGGRLQEGMLNRVSAVVRAYDPCLSCSTHNLGEPALAIDLVAADGTLLDRQTNC